MRRLAPGSGLRAGRVPPILRKGTRPDLSKFTDVLAQFKLLQQAAQAAG